MLPRALAALCVFCAPVCFAAAPAGSPATLVEREGRVVVTRHNATPAPATVGMPLAARDRLGTGEASRAVLRMSERWFARIDEETDIEITPGALGAQDQDSLKIALGGAYIFSREAEGAVKVRTPSVTGGLRGTQLLVRVAPDGHSTLQVLEGEVDLANDQGTLLLRRGEAGEAAPGQAPRRTAAVDARNLLQWTLYYPAVLPAEELGLDAAGQRELAASLAAYRAGDLPAALAQLPRASANSSPAAYVYRAAVVLATGRVTRARDLLARAPADHPGRRAVERLLAAVQGDELPPDGPPATAGLALAESYHRQSRHQLPAALAAARRATELAPDSGFAWARVAELEFSFGATAAATHALDRALRLAPRHAQAHALRGFLLSADHRLAEAQAAFREAIGIDPALGHAWLGLGLTKIRQGRAAEGRADLQTATVLEPTRSFFFSYHAKALAQTGEPALARKDLAVALQLDPADPTPHLYAALQDQQEYRFESALQALEESVRRNANRRVYRSRLLLDQDRAVRGANLAKIYQHNGLVTPAVRAAAGAVESDYTSAAAHQFLAHSFDALRDPDRISLRFETAWFNEHLLASLLAPVGGGPLSQFVSQQEYSRLFEADRTGGSLVAEWRSDGRRHAQGSLFSTAGRLQLGVDLAHTRRTATPAEPGTELTEAFVQAKYQVSADDILYALARGSRQTGGDLAPGASGRPPAPDARLVDRQHPGLLLLGWNRAWQPGVHTLFIAGRLAARQEQTSPFSHQDLLGRDPAALVPGLLQADAAGRLAFTSAALRDGPPPAAILDAGGALVLSPAFRAALAPYLGQAPVTAVYAPEPFGFTTARDLVIHTAELQQIWRLERHTLLAGGRWQPGEFDTTARLDLLNPALQPVFTRPASDQRTAVDFERRSAYAYALSEVAPGLRLLAGVAWDHVRRPRNFRNPPLSPATDTTEQTSAKAGFTYALSPAVTLRGAYTEALGGVTFDESVRLEPVQFAGFEQTFRTVIAESLVGAVETPGYRQTGLGADGRWSDRTWWHATATDLRERVRRTVGLFEVFSAPAFPAGALIAPGSTPESLDYRERTLAAGLHHLPGGGMAFGATVRRTVSDLRRRFPQVPSVLTPGADRRQEATLDVVNLSALRHSPAGWFVRVEARWIRQTLAAGGAGAAPVAQPGDEFWQGDLLAGVRFRRNQCEFSAGVLNVGDRDHRLNPLTHLTLPPRERTAVFRLRVSY
jgi:tetratricopeptide (TPR) repeat protein